MLNTLTKPQSSNNLAQANDNSNTDSTRTSLQKSPSVIFENSLNNSEQQKEENLAEQEEIPVESLNIITNTANDNLLNVNTLSPGQHKNNSPSSNNSSTNTSTTSNTTNQTSSTNSSFNQTSFVFSPDKDTANNISKKSDELNKYQRPGSKPIAPVLPDQVKRNIHNRANSVIISKQSSLMASIGSGINTYSGVQNPTRTSALSLANIAPSISQQLMNTIDDNIFINNTFSFLDDLESNAGDYLAEFKEMNIIAEKEEINNPVQDDKASIDYENFPWHAIYPANDQSQTQLDSQAKPNQGKSKTLPHDSSADMLSNSFGSKESSQIFNISSKTKPMAPKIKGSATIGPTSGLSALKTMNTLAKNLQHQTESTDGSKQDLQSNNSISSGLVPERRRSVTRIVSSDSLSNLNNRSPSTNPGQTPNQSSNGLQSRFVFKIYFFNYLLVLGFLS